MLSELTEAMIVNGVVLATVRATDLGPARRIGPMRMLRPVIAAAVIVPVFMSGPVTHGAGLAVEIAGVVAGLLGGLAAVALMGVYRNPETGKPVSRAGVPYAILWIVVIGAKAAFSWGAAHWFTAALVNWAVTNQVTEAAITDGLIFMAVAMLIVRTAGIGLRASRLPVQALAAQSAEPAAGPPAPRAGRGGVLAGPAAAVLAPARPGLAVAR